MQFVITDRSQQGLANGGQPSQPRLSKALSTKARSDSDRRDKSSSRCGSSRPPDYENGRLLDDCFLHNIEAGDFFETLAFAKERRLVGAAATDGRMISADVSCRTDFVDRPRDSQ
jgi:hypothetical protein